MQQMQQMPKMIFAEWVVCMRLRLTEIRLASFLQVQLNRKSIFKTTFLLFFYLCIYLFLGGRGWAAISFLSARGRPWIACPLWTDVTYVVL